MSALDFAGKGRPLSQEAVQSGLSTLGISKATFWAVMAVETRGFGFLADRRPLILYERHVFHRLTAGKHSPAHSDVSSKSAGGYGAGGAHQYDRLAKAITLSRKAALESASWGLGQVMGFNAKAVGFSGVAAMIAEMSESEDAQTTGMVHFIENNGLAKLLKAKKWAAFAKAYNGKDFKKNNYDVKLENAFNLYSASPTPSLEVRLVQTALLYLGFNPKGIDGIFGLGSQKALIAYQKSISLKPDGKLSDAISARLAADAELD